MASSGATQALLGSFFFGILFNAASAALVLYVIGHGSAIFRDGLRLVLIFFLASSAAWALVEFLATIIEPTAASTCQVAVVFSSIFDQLGRVFVEQYLVWATRAEGKTSVVGFIPQTLLLGRFGAGIAFIALTGSEFNPTCAPISKSMPVAVIVIALDAIILAAVAIQALSMASTENNKKRSVIIVTIGLGIWIGMSVVFLLGLKATALVLKTTLPALGLAILVGLVTVFSGSLVAPRGPPPPRPDSPTARDLGLTRDLSSSDSAAFPPSRYEDLKNTATMTMTAYASRNEGIMSGIGGLGGQGNAKRNVKLTKGPSGKLVISNPVLMAQEGMENPLDRILTIDLATAASNEKERRIKLAQGGSPLVAQRRAPQPPSTEQDGMLARERSTRRKQVAPLNRSASTKTTKTTAGLSVEANASSTSSELSPGSEMMRKRSPRQPSAPPVPTGFQPVRPGEPIRIPIPRSRTPPESPKSPEPVKTPLQRRATTGLPSNPRARAMRQNSVEKDQRQETVMFINNIVYDNPNAVSDVVRGAAKTPMTSLDSADSVVNRPRPIPRKGDKDRQVFPAELSPSQGHRRTKSSGSLIHRKSILQSMPGSPTQLPPLPPPPKSAGSLSRPLPNDTKSMTFDEKMSILYPTENKGRSLIPEMPPLPATYYVDSQRRETDSVPEAEANSERRTSKTTDRSSVRTTSVLGIEDVPQLPAQKAGGAGEELGQSWLPGISVDNERQSHLSLNKTNRKSSPVIPAESRFSESSIRTESRTRDDDATTVWGSVYSPVAAVEIQKLRKNARSTYIQKDISGSEKQMEQSQPTKAPAETTVATQPEAFIANFHHRIGEECPTFSTRKDTVRPRKMPPPAPLILTRRNTRRAMVVQAAEPSPLESPEVAYQMIQAQLQKLEQPDPEPEESEERRLELLQDLEREMGQLENKWQSRLDRDSMSTIQSSPAKDSRPASLATDRRASRRISMRNAVLRSRGEENTGVPSSESSGVSSENIQASAWQVRLAESQTEFMENTPTLITKRNNLNFLSVSKAALGSPSPPDTDESEYESDIPIGIGSLSMLVSQPIAQMSKLWRPQSPVQHTVDSGLWVGVVKKPETASDVHELPSVSVRPATRKIWGPLPIESSRLWEKPVKAGNVGIADGMWKKFDPSQGDITITRPLATRPPRKNKRVTALPDILENPEPLPDKRGTLGLFQFPWGEKSENASVQPRSTRMFMAMPGTMTTGGPSINLALDARSRQLETEEFTTSFFDDYEAEEEGDNFDFSDSDDGDDFDENTLWEIASLLKTERLPSKNSLLPLPEQDSTSVLSPGSPINATEMLVDEYHDDGLVQEEPIPVDRFSFSTSESVFPQSLTWTAQPALEIHIFGLPQPNPAIWNSYMTEPSKTVRSKAQFGDVLPIHSSSLWKSAPKDNGMSVGLLWSPRKPVHSISSAPVKAKKTPAPSMLPSLWVQPKTAPVSEFSGLFNATHPRADYRKTSSEPAALVMSRKTRAVEMSLAKLTSEALWTGRPAAKSSLTWEKPKVVEVPEHDGLFEKNMSRSDFRRTAKEPAALVMAKKTRMMEMPLAKLTSKALWTGSPVAKVSLTWEKPKTTEVPERDGLFERNMSRSDFRRTAKEPAAISTGRTPRKTEAPLVNLETKSLWAKEISVFLEPIRGARLFTPKKSLVPASQLTKKSAAPKVQTVLLWEKREVIEDLEYNGLFNVSVARNSYRTTSEAPAAIFMPKKPRMGKEPLPKLMTSNLWTREPLEPKAPVAIPEPVSMPEKVATSTHARSLWEATPVITESDYQGLFDVKAARKDYRRTSKLPVAMNINRKPRKTVESLATLASTKLWQSYSGSRSMSSANSVALWIKSSVSVPIMLGLFKVDSNRKVYRTTSAEPVALQMTRKLRLVEESLPRLESSQLWTVGQTSSVELDWITISSTRPRSPSISSVTTASSAPSSPVTDSSSIKTSTTKASSAKGSFFGGWFGRKRKGSEVPSIPEVSTPKDIPEIPAVPELPEGFVVKNLDETPSKKPAHIPIRQSNRVNIAYRADWDDALREAIRDSYPGTMAALRASYPQDWEMELQAAIKASHISPKITRRAASPRDWSNALHEAIIASHPDIRFSRGQMIPAQWRAQLREAISESYPPQPTDFDVSIRHPVFMGSLETTAETIHPAVSPKMIKRRGSYKNQAKSLNVAIGPKTSASMLWSKSPKPANNVMGGLWIPSSSSPKAEMSSQIEVSVVRPSPRKAKNTSRSFKLPTFGEQGMWRRGTNSNSQNRDWLDDSMKKRFSRVELRY
ncbi:hypothetical protein M426DRAFT_204130 [Hypoxylon sp. CI-4A]|nr:hypothetical protein M426DRAFT_204130 [Hypoxylon sp. CI-4A]